LIHLRKFFDILEEVKKEEQTTIETLLAWISFGKEEITTYQKSIPCGAKGACVEESKKEYTGDALALRGDERRDKLR
jgi:hypothetical protein